jgi:hypothetical protein
MRVNEDRCSIGVGQWSQWSWGHRRHGGQQQGERGAAIEELWGLGKRSGPYQE